MHLKHEICKMYFIVNLVINFLSGIIGTYYVFGEVGIQFVNIGLFYNDK
jgi:hypothetical protein